MPATATPPSPLAASTTRGFEGLTITPDGTTLYAILQVGGGSLAASEMSKLEGFQGTLPGPFLPWGEEKASARVSHLCKVSKVH